jgi:hypothetical protein
MLTYALDDVIAVKKLVTVLPEVRKKLVVNIS